ncbi:MAG: hypothetical protein AABM43_10395 [Actinomycetota bacterium]
MTSVPPVGQLVGLVKLLRRGPYTNDPADPSYPDHQYTQGLRSDESLQNVYPATVVSHGVKAPATVRQTNHGFYVDPLRMPQGGMIGSVGNAILKRADLTTSHRYDADAVLVEQPTANRLRLRPQPGVEVRARTDGFVGRPNDLPPRQQIANALAFLTAK